MMDLLSSMSTNIFSLSTEYILTHLVSHDASLWTTPQLSVRLSYISTVTNVLSLCKKQENDAHHQDKRKKKMENDKNQNCKESYDVSRVSGVSCYKGN